MAPVAVTSANAEAIATADDQRSFRVIFVTTFIAVLAIALVSQALMLRWRPWFPGAESTRSLVGGVRAAVSSFMSQLI
jgi:light-harvesting complex 1 beta chain